MTTDDKSRSAFFGLLEAATNYAREVKSGPSILRKGLRSKLLRALKVARREAKNVR